MLIYEKENKLNINFDNEVSEQPDLQISKEDGKTSVTIDGQPSGGGGGVFAVEFTSGQQYHLIADKTLKEIYDNAFQGILCKIVRDESGEFMYASSFANFNFTEQFDGYCFIHLNMVSGGIGYSELYMEFSSREEIDWNTTDWNIPD